MSDQTQQSSTAAGDAHPEKPTNRRKRERRKLRVVFDTSVLFTGSSSELVRQDAENLIRQSNFPDLDIQWYLPDVVRLERQFQMQKSALDLLAPLSRVEKVLGHKLNITEEILIDRVEKVIGQRQKELGLLTLKPNYMTIDWDRIVLDSAFRRPPFQDGKTEKGFRDALVLQSLIYLINDSPKTPKVCRIVFVTADALLASAVEAQIAGSANAAVIPSLEELRGLINTLVSEVDEDFVAALKPRASKLFYVPKEESSLYYKENISQQLTTKFVKELASVPTGASGRNNGGWRISSPNFVKKTGQRIQWASRIEIEAEATKTIRSESQTMQSTLSIIGSALKSTNVGWLPSPASNRSLSVELRPDPGLVTSKFPFTGLDRLTASEILLGAPTETATRTITTHKGLAVFEVSWSVDVITSGDLRRPSIDDIVHVETNWEAVA